MNVIIYRSSGRQEAGTYSREYIYGLFDHAPEIIEVDDGYLLHDPDSTGFVNVAASYIALDEANEEVFDFLYGTVVLVRED